MANGIKYIFTESELRDVLSRIIMEETGSAPTSEPTEGENEVPSRKPVGQTGDTDYNYNPRNFRPGKRDTTARGSGNNRLGIVADAGSALFAGLKAGAEVAGEKLQHAGEVLRDEMQGKYDGEYDFTPIEGQNYGALEQFHVNDAVTWLLTNAKDIPDDVKILSDGGWLPGGDAMMLTMALRKGGLDPRGASMTMWGLPAGYSKFFKKILPSNGWDQLSDDADTEIGDVMIIMPVEGSNRTPGYNKTGSASMKCGPGLWVSTFKHDPDWPLGICPEYCASNPRDLMTNEDADKLWSSVFIYRYRNRV